MEIVSRANNLVKHIKKLADKKYRRELGQYVAEGRRWVTDALAYKPEAVVTVVRRESCDFAPADAVLSDALFNELADTENSQGVLAVMRIPPLADLQGGPCLFLDRIRDPGNMGTILRTACAAGFREVILSDCVDVYNPKVIRSCMTGILDLRFVAVPSVSALKESGYTLVCASMGGEDAFAPMEFHKSVCLIIGNEASGVDEKLSSACEKVLTIPMEGKIESLNAAVAAGILMYRIRNCIK